MERLPKRRRLTGQLGHQVRHRFRRFLKLRAPGDGDHLFR
jgi:hypothetical protein